MKLWYIIAMLFSFGCAQNSTPAKVVSLYPFAESFNAPYMGAWTGSGHVITTPRTDCAVKLSLDGVSSDTNQIRIQETELACSNGETHRLASRTLLIKGNQTFEGDVIVGVAYQPNQNPFGPLPNTGYRSFSYNIDIPELGAGPYIMTLGVYPKNTFKDDPIPALFMDVSLRTDRGNFIGFTALLRPKP